MRRTTLVTAFLSSLVALAGACTDGGESLIILQNQAPGTGCQISASAGSDFISRGEIEVASPVGYLFTPLVRSLVNETQSSQRLVVVQGADVDITLPDGVTVDPALLSFSQRFSGTITAGGDTSFAFEIVPRPLLEALAGTVSPDRTVQLIARVSVFGTLDGGDVKSVPFDYPVDVCEGCLVVNNGSCSALSGEFVPRTGNDCNPFQDQVVDCCDDGTGLICPAVVPPPA
jgi:hypothetical protein